MSIQSHNPLQPPQKLTRSKSSPNLTTSEVSEKISPQSVSPVLKNSESELQTLNPEDMKQIVMSSLEQSSSQQMTQVSEHIPHPKGLLEAVEKAGKRSTENRDMASIEKLENKLNEDREIRLKTPLSSVQPQKKVYKEKEIGSSSDVQSLAKLYFSPKLSEMDSSVLRKGSVRQSAQKLAFKRALELPADALLRMKSRGSDALRLDLAKGLGLVKSEEQLDGLSDNKKAFLNSLVAGIEKAYTEKQGVDISTFVSTQFKKTLPTTRNPEALSQALRQVLSELPAGGNMAWNLTVRPEAELKQDIAKGLGFKMPLSQPHETLVKDVLKGIQEHLPNRMSSNGNEIVLNGERFQRKGELGQGGFGKVFEYESINEPKRSVAVKESLNPNNREALVKELDVYRHIMGPQGKGHDNITSMQAAVKGPNDSLYVVMDMLSGGDYNHLANTQNWALQMGILSKTSHGALLQDQLRGMNEGLHYLHEEVGVIHHDHKLENVFVDQKGNLKVGDFGGARRIGMDNSPIQRTNQGYVNQEGQVAITDNYASPRLRTLGGDGKEIQTDATDDNFTHGLAFQKAVGGSTEIYGVGNFGVKGVKAFMEDENARIRSQDPTAFGQLVNGLTDKDHETRTTTQEVKDSDFIQDVGSYDPVKLAKLKEANVKLSQVAGKQLLELHNFTLGLKGTIQQMEKDNLNRSTPKYSPQRIDPIRSLVAMSDKAVKLLSNGKTLEPPQFSLEEQQILNTPHPVESSPENKMRAHIKTLAQNPYFLQAVQDLQEASRQFNLSTR